MSLADKLDDYIRAGNTALWVLSWEPEEALIQATALCKANQWVLFNWDPAEGLQLINTEVALPNFTKPEADAAMVQTFAQLEATARERMKVKNAPTTPSTLLLLHNFHDQLSGSAVLKQRLAKAAFRGRKSRAFIIVISPLLKIPPELEKLFTVVEHDLPDRAALKKIAKTLATEKGEYPEDASGEQAVLDAATGMSRVEAENAISLSIIRHRQIDPLEVWQEKSRGLLRDGLLTLERKPASFADLGGLDFMKRFHLELLTEKHEHPLARPKGTLLLSPPGCGKSQFTKALGFECNRPTLRMDFGALMGGVVGKSEQNLRTALRTADAMAPCIMQLDELEKAFAGMRSSLSDGGIANRMFGMMLSWLNDHDSEVFVIATCNDVGKLLETNPEFVRAERFDGIFFIDLPDAAERDAIWEIYLRQFDISERDNPRPEDDGWTGSEIRTCCRLAKMRKQKLRAAARLVVPARRLMESQLEDLRKWATGRCLSAATESLYGAPAEEAPESADAPRVISRVRRVSKA